MRRGRQHTITEYIDIRISQLANDMAKAKDEYDKQWYNRIIQELSWARDQDHNCYMSKESDAADRDLENWKDKYWQSWVQ